MGKLIIRAILLAGFLSVLGVMAAFGQEDVRVKGFWQYQEGKYAEAVETFQGSLKTDPGDGFALKYLAASLENLGKREEAVKAFVEPYNTDRTPAIKFDKELKITSKAQADLMDEAISRRVNGTVLLMVEFKQDATIGFIVPVLTLPNGVTEKCVKAASKTKFTPAQVDGKPVSVVRIMTYTIGR